MATTTKIVKSILGEAFSETMLNPEANHFAPSHSHSSLVNYHDASNSEDLLCGGIGGIPDSRSNTSGTHGPGYLWKSDDVRTDTRDPGQRRTSPERYALEIQVLMADTPGEVPPRLTHGDVPSSGTCSATAGLVPKLSSC